MPSSFRALTMLLFLVLAFQVRAQPENPPPPRTPEEASDAARKNLAELRKTLAEKRDALDPVDSQKIERCLDTAAKALDDYVQSLRKGEERSKAMAPLAMAGTVTVADDVTGVGVADDWLLPIIGIGVIVTYLKTSAPSEDGLKVAHTNLLISLQAANFAIQVALAKKKNDGKCHCQCARLGERGDSYGRMRPSECKSLCNFKGFPVSICK